MKSETQELKRMKRNVIDVMHMFGRACGIEIAISEVFVHDPAKLAHASGLVDFVTRKLGKKDNKDGA